VRTVHTIGILVPLVPLAVVAVLGLGERDLATGLGPGGTAQWLYPPSAVRDLVAYGGVAIWLLRELRRRTPAEFAPLLWRAPLIYALANLLLPVPFVLVNGEARQLVAEQGGWMALRVLARLLIGFGYVALLVFIREQLRQDGALETGD
jgi:hypothetical protein